MKLLSQGYSHAPYGTFKGWINAGATETLILIALNTIRVSYPRQESITRSLHLPYYPSQTTLSRIFLFLEALRRGALVGVFTISNHKRPMVSHVLRHIRM